MKEFLFNNSNFEKVVRKAVNIFDRSITEDDVKKIEVLDCTDFDFSNEDFPILIKFEKLKELALSTPYERMNFLKSLTNLEDLYLEVWNNDNVLAFNDFKNAKSLKSLHISGGAYSNINLINLEHLQALKSLKYLGLHEFGNVNLAPLENMLQLEEFYCGYGNVFNIEVVQTLKNLKTLTLIDFSVENLNFLDSFPDDIELELCGIEVKEGIDIEYLKRFTNADISEITVGRKMIIGSDGLK